jgi:hypothetical protein
MNIDEIFRSKKLYMGRMISGSKKSPVGCQCVWNANIIIRSRGKIWYGDINITKEGKKLKEVSKEIGETIYVLREHDARFGTESDNIESLISKAVWSTDKDVSS